MVVKLAGKVMAERLLQFLNALTARLVNPEKYCNSLKDVI